MSKNFINKNFLLKNQISKKLYHNYAKKMPIFDYHCHLPPKQIADDINFENLTQIWLYGDHYKWRAMRSNGVDEKFCTGDASDYDKFMAWAKTVPHTIKNPLYHWTHLELARYFGINVILNEETAKNVYDSCSEMLKTKDFSVRNLMQKMNVKIVCTTDDPIDTLEHHLKIKKDGFEIKVLPAFRPDKGMAVESTEAFNDWVDKLEKISEVEIKNYDTYISAIKRRHDFFHDAGCRISDHGIETAYAEDYSEKEIKDIFNKIRSKKNLDYTEVLKFKSAMMIEFALMDHSRGWAQQLHFGALRNNNTRLFKKLGPDTGFDSIGDFDIAKPLAKFLNRLDIENKLPKTILYNLNPRDNELMATMIGNFQDGSIPGKMQYGSGWWFLDQMDGMEKQMTALSNLGLLSRFVGMLTDSRSFLSYTRHEYFRRILCNMIGNDVKNGEIPNDLKLLSDMIENICYNNAINYFNIN
ncbi:MAG: glucuronate isomerase [Spirochaetes bacterium]|nr:glucuronate isomerase [Spirochaetota bacterium]